MVVIMCQGIVVGTFQTLLHFLLWQPWEVFNDEKTKAKLIVWSHSADKWQSWNSNPCSSDQVPRIQMPRPGIQPLPPVVEVWNLNAWTTRESPQSPFLKVVESSEFWSSLDPIFPHPYFNLRVVTISLLPSLFFLFVSCRLFTCLFFSLFFFFF